MIGNRFSLKGFLEDIPIWGKIVFIILIPLFFSILFLLINNGMLSLFHISDEITVLKLTQLFSATGMFICSSFVLAYLFSRHVRQFLSFRSANFAVLILAVFSMLSTIPLINFLGDLNNQIAFPEAWKSMEEIFRSYEEKIAELTELLLISDNSLSGLLLNLLILAIIPALGEELLFRGVIQKTLSKSLKNQILAIWITAFLFSAVHFQFYGFIPRFLLGAYLGYLLVWSKSIWVPIAAHFTNNAIIVLVYFFVQDKNLISKLETVGADGSSLWLFGSVLLFSLLTAGIWKICREKKIRIEDEN